MTLSISEDVRFQRALLELYESANLSLFPDRILEAVQQLIPGEIAAFTEVNYRTGEIWGSIRPNRRHWDGFKSVEQSYEILQRYFHQHPVVTSFRKEKTGSARRISDYLSAPAFHETGLYQEMFRKLRVEDQLVHMMPTSPDCGAGLAVSRGERSFRSVHIDRLNRLGPHMIQAYRNARRVTQLEEWKTVPERSVAVAMEELGLGRRQSEVLRAVASGLGNNEAAALLGVSPLTIKKHLENIYAVLGVGSRSAAVARLLRRLGLETGPTQPRA